LASVHRQRRAGCHRLGGYDWGAGVAAGVADRRREPRSLRV